MAEEISPDQAIGPIPALPRNIELDIPRAICRAFPWLQLTRALGMSFAINKLAIAILGLLLLQLVCGILDNRLLDAETAQQNSMTVSYPGWYDASFPLNYYTFVGAIERLAEPFQVLIRPLLRFVTVNPFDRIGIHSGLSSLATILIWGLFGGALARVALAQVGRGGGVGLRGAFKYAIKHIRPLVATPLLPVVVLLMTALACATFGLIFKLPGMGNLIGGLFLIVPIGLGLLMFVLVAGLAIGWPLMVVSVAAEGEDELDALSRSFSYLNHRLGHYFFYLVVAFLIGLPGSWLISLIADGTLFMTRWGLGLTVSRESLHALFSPGIPLLDFARPAGTATAAVPEPSWTWFLPAFWIGFVRLVARAWAYSYFWSSLSIIYLLIRKDVDGAEWTQLKADEIDPATS